MRKLRLRRACQFPEGIQPREAESVHSGLCLPLQTPSLDCAEQWAAVLVLGSCVAWTSYVNSLNFGFFTCWWLYLLSRVVMEEKVVSYEGAPDSARHRAGSTHGCFLPSASRRCGFVKLTEWSILLSLRFSGPSGKPGMEETLNKYLLNECIHNNLYLCWCQPSGC